LQLVTSENQSTPASDELARLLRASDGRSRERTPGCPDEQLIAAYFDELLGPPERQKMEAHLADCAHCLALVGLLGRHDDDGEAAVPDTAQARARKLARPGAPARHAPRWAAAAAALLAIPVLLHLSRSTDESPAFGSDAGTRGTRNLPPIAHDLQVLRPIAGSVVAPNDLSVRWSPVLGSAYYDVRIVNDTGLPVVEQRVTGTEWRPDAGLRLQPGVEYYVRVDAYPADGKSVGSVHVPFTVRE
jgi:hypothetical protein